MLIEITIHIMIMKKTQYITVIPIYTTLNNYSIELGISCNYYPVIGC